MEWMVPVQAAAAEGKFVSQQVRRAYMYCAASSAGDVLYAFHDQPS